MSELRITGSYNAGYGFVAITPATRPTLAAARRHVTALLMAGYRDLDVEVVDPVGEVVAYYTSGEGWA